MSRRRIAASIVLALVALPMGVCAAEASRRPNVVLIVVDDMGFADLGVQGSRDVASPAIDRLARDGVRFTNAYASGPQCSPTRAALLTGRYQQRFGHEFNPPDDGPQFGMPTGETTLADRMKAAGYTTGLIGKWHLGTAPQYHPQRRGFDEFFGFLTGVHFYFPTPDEPIFRGTTRMDEREYLTDAFAREAVAFITAHRATPFFLYVAFNAVHGPMQADPARLARVATIADERRRTYVAMMLALDEAVGRITAALESKELLANTLVIFLNDNGGRLMNGARNDPLRGAKRSTLEGGLRVPLFLHWPAQLPKGTVFDPLVMQFDLMPTVLAAAGIPVRPEWKLDGVDLLPHLARDREPSLGPPHEALFWRFGEQMAIRRGPWKLVRYDRAAEGGRGISPPVLYDLAHDVGETTDLAARHPERVKELHRAWDAWNAQNIPPLWSANRE